MLYFRVNKNAMSLSSVIPPVSILHPRHFLRQRNVARRRGSRKSCSPFDTLRIGNIDGYRLPRMRRPTYPDKVSPLLGPCDPIEGIRRSVYLSPL
ncbi:hypothetical protein MLD38_008790 [Melastoma candidum]|uniref:Uncharacterized protein n=1 Tax=Melastoma candidum TaxID=119954 RepID=A0ACB9RV37_9MYRT|nr:hypothetical protein MLD38_008790 [Melastoma candidum]